MEKLYPLMGRRSPMELKNKLTVIKTIMRTLAYGSVAWGYAAKSYMRELESEKNVYLQAAANTPWYVRNKKI